MKTGKKYIKPLILAGAAMLAVMGCSSQSSDTEGATDTTAETTTEAAVVLQKVTYTASDGSVSIILPDSNWTNTLDEDGQLTFVSPGEGKITITYGDTKKEVNRLAFGVNENKLKKRLTKLGENTDNLEIQDFSFNKSDGVRNCSYTLKYTDTTGGTYYAVTSVMASAAKGYQITGTLEVGDATLLSAVKDSVNSFLILNNPLTGSAQTDGNETGSTDNGGSSSEEQRYFYDEPGNTIYVTQDNDGAWVDESGTAYYFYENHVEDGNGTVYYYDPPAYREGGELYSGSGDGQESSGGSDSTDGSESTDVYYDFYDSEGNYIKATQDANGNWVGDDGKTYTFGDEGVTDSDGNYYPY